MKAKINGVALAYEDIGSGPAVVLIHGFPLCRKMWEPQVEAMVTAGYRVVVPDLRGFGESDSPAGDYSMSVFADDIRALLQSLGIEKAVIGGMSMGGYVLFDLLERHPQSVSAAMFLVTRAAADDEQGRARRTKLAQEVANGSPRVVIEAFEQILFAPETAEARPDLIARVKRWMSMTPPRGLAGGLVAMRDRKDYVDNLSAFNIPALVVGAGQDRAVPMEHSRVLSAGLPNSRLCIISGAGHMANLEVPEKFNACILEFLQGLK